MMSHHAGLLAVLGFLACVVAVITAPSADPLSVLIQAAWILAVALPAYLLGYRGRRRTAT